MRNGINSWLTSIDPPTTDLFGRPLKPKKEKNDDYEDLVQKMK